MALRQIHSEEELQKAISDAGGHLVCVDFSATWCGPCKRIAPKIEEFAKKYTDVVFLSVVEGDADDAISARRIDAFPTFHFYLKGTKVDEVRGASAQEVEEKIAKYRGSSAGLSQSESVPAK